MILYIAVQHVYDSIPCSFKTLLESSSPSALLSSADYQKLEEELSSTETAQKDQVWAGVVKNTVISVIFIDNFNICRSLRNFHQ